MGSFVFFNVQKTKYLQLLTSAMRWLAFTIMIVYAVKNLISHGAQGNPPVANIMGKFIRVISKRKEMLSGTFSSVLIK